MSPVQVDRIEVVERIEGRGGRIEMPIARVWEGIRGDRIDSDGGEGDFDLTRERLAEIVANFGDRVGPVPVYFGHLPAAERRTEPAAGFIERVWIEGDLLMGGLKLNERAFDAVVEQEGFRGFSIEVLNNFRASNRDFSGYYLSGGAITNVPAVHVEAIAASTDEPGFPAVRLTTALPAIVQERRGEPSMSNTITLEALTKERDGLVTKLEKARADLKERDERILKLERDHETNVKSLQTKLDETNKRIEEAEQKALARDVREQIRLGLDAGKITPAQVEGYDEDPAKWLSGSPFNGIEGLRKFLETAKPVVKLGPRAVGTGDPADGSGGAKTAIAEFDEKVKALGAKEKLDYNAAFSRVKALEPALYQRASAEREAAQQEG